MSAREPVTSSPSQSVSAVDPAVQGMVIMGAAMMVLPLMDAASKALTTWHGVSPGQVTFLRFAFQSVLAAFIAWWMLGPAGLRAGRLWLNLLRGALIGIASLCFFAAVKYMPLADAMAVFFVEPFILTLLSVIALKERVGWRRYAAMAVGFFGALVVIQPSWELFGPVSLLPLGTATLFSVYLILNKTLAAHDEPITMQFTAGIGGTVALGIAMLVGNGLAMEDFAVSMPGAVGWSLLFAIGAISTVGHLAVVQAFKRAPASLLAPFQYFEIVMAVLFGLLLFGDFPSASKWLGIALIVASGLYLFHREQVVSRRRRQA